MWKVSAWDADYPGKKNTFLWMDFVFGDTLAAIAAWCFRDRCATLSCSEAAKTPVKRW